MAKLLRRLFLAWALAVCSVGVSVWRKHAWLDSSRPWTLLNLLRDEFGVLALLCVGWLWFEAVRLVLSPAGSELRIRWPKGRWERRRWIRES